MSYVQNRNGIYRYRRVVPPELRQHLLKVPGWPDAASRVEFAVSLRTREAREANYKAADLDRGVQAALDSARDRLRAETNNEGAAPLPTAPRPTVITPSGLMVALRRWEAAEVARMQIEALNGFEVRLPATRYPELRDIITRLESAPGQADVPIMTSAINLVISSLEGNVDLHQMIADALQPIGLPITPDHPAMMFATKPALEMLKRLVQAQRRFKDGDLSIPSKAAVNIAFDTDTPPDDSAPFLLMLEEWEKLQSMKYRQLKNYASDIRSFGDSIKNRSVNSVTRKAVQEWIERLASVDKLTKKTIERKLTAVRRYWKYLQTKEIALENLSPFSNLIVPDLNAGVEPRAFTPTEVVEVWREALKIGQPVLAKAIRIAAYTGARIESIYQLTPRHIVEDRSSGTAVKVLRFSDKTDAGRRLVPIHSAISKLISDLAAKPTNDGFLLEAKANKRNNERSSTPSKTFGRLKMNMGFGPELRFHSIRKTVATLFQHSGCKEEIAADILGHEIATMSYGLYSTGSSIDQRQEWIEKALVYPDDEFTRGQESLSTDRMRSMAGHGGKDSAKP